MSNKSKFLFKKRGDIIGNAPCKDCKKRQIGCHQTCESYACWRNEKDDEHTKILQNTLLDMICYKHNNYGMKYRFNH